MGLFAIGDLHLSSGLDKPMDVFGEQWTNHYKKIEHSWIKSVGKEDIILIPGDISWAMHLKEAIKDLEWISSLPGKKILLRGNHDYWWGSITKMNTLFHNIYFLQNNYYTYKDWAICGARGWISPNKNRFTEQDHKIYMRELHRLNLSIEEAVKNNYSNILVMTHYPPTNDQLEPSGFTNMYERYKVKRVVYGHLHGEEAFKGSLQGEYRGTFYNLVSCDYLGFQPQKILE